MLDFPMAGLAYANKIVQRIRLVARRKHTIGNDIAMDRLRYMCQYLAEPKRGGGVLLATFTEDEEQSYRAQEVANNGSRFTTDFRDLYYGNDIEW